MSKGIPGLRGKHFINETELKVIPYDTLENRLTVIGRFKQLEDGPDAGEYETVAVIPHPDKSQDPLIVIVSDDEDTAVLLTTRNCLITQLESPLSFRLATRHASKTTIQLYDQYLVALHDEMILEND